MHRAIAALAGAGTIRQFAATLEPGVAELCRSIRLAVVADIPAFSASGNPQLLLELDQHVSDHVREIQRLIGGGTFSDFEFLKFHVHRRAEQRFPLEAMLHAYRCAHTLQSRWIGQAAIAANPQHLERVAEAVADFATEYTNTVSTIAAAEYVAHTRVLAEQEVDHRTQLLNMLLTGYDESDARVARLLKRAGYLEQRQVFCVALVQSTDPLEMENAARVRRIAESLTNAVASFQVRTLIGIRNNVVTAVLSDVRRLSGWTAPQTGLADRIRRQLDVLGPVILIGLSNDQPSTSFIPRALHEATVALDFANVNERIVQFSELSIRRLLLHRGGDYVQHAIPQWMVRFEEADAKADGTLLQTLRALADADLNMQRAARALSVHPNTLYARMNRINSLTGRDVQRYHDLTELLLAADCRLVGPPASP